MMKEKKTIKKKSQLNFYSNNNYNYMINDEKEKNDKEKITIKFLLSNNYNYMINDERRKKQ